MKIRNPEQNYAETALADLIIMNFGSEIAGRKAADIHDCCLPAISIRAENSDSAGKILFSFDGLNAGLPHENHMKHAVLQKEWKGYN